MALSLCNGRRRLGARHRRRCRGASSGSLHLAHLSADLGGMAIGEICHLLEEEIDRHLKLGGSDGKKRVSKGPERVVASVCMFMSTHKSFPETIISHLVWDRNVPMDSQSISVFATPERIFHRASSLDASQLTLTRATISDRGSVPGVHIQSACSRGATYCRRIHKVTPGKGQPYKNSVGRLGVHLGRAVLEMRNKQGRNGATRRGPAFFCLWREDDVDLVLV